MEFRDVELHSRPVSPFFIPNLFYRTDIGERWSRDGDLLQTWGYLS